MRCSTPSAFRRGNGRSWASMATISTPSPVACSQAITGRSTRFTGVSYLLLYRTVLERLGPDRVSLGHRAQGYHIEDDGSGVSLLVQTPGSDDLTAIGGKLLLGADGLHSAIRAQMHPDQPPSTGVEPHVAGCDPCTCITGSSFVGLGEEDRRLVIYPISQPDADGLSLINWIAEIRVDSQQGWEGTGWYNEVEVDSFLHHFEGMKYDWLDVPAMLAPSRSPLKIR